MTTAVFTVAMNDSYGMLGFRLRGKPHFEPLGSMAVAHDLLEHFPDDNGGPEGELEALGASLFIRGLTGAYINGSAARNLQPDVVRLFREYHPGALLAPPATLGTKRVLTPDDEETEAQIDELLTRLRRPDEWDATLHGTDLITPDQQQAMAAWLRRGYRRARRRYGNPWHVSYLFTAIENGVSKLEHHIEEGMELRIKYSAGRNACTLHDITLDYPY